MTDALASVDLNFTDLSSITKPGPTMVSANFDGASVTMGSKTGVIAKIRQEVSNILQTHCVAHKLELAILDAVKEMPILKKL